MTQLQRPLTFLPTPCCGLPGHHVTVHFSNWEVAVEGSDCSFDTALVPHPVGDSVCCLDGRWLEESLYSSCQGGGVKGFAVEGAGTSAGGEDHVGPERLTGMVSFGV